MIKIFSGSLNIRSQSVFFAALLGEKVLCERDLVVISLILTPWVIPNPSTLHSQGVKRTNTELVFSKRVESEKKIKISGWTNDFFRVKEWWLTEREKFKTRRLLQNEKKLLKRKSEDFWRPLKTSRSESEAWRRGKSLLDWEKLKKRKRQRCISSLLILLGGGNAIRRLKLSIEKDAI